MKYYLLAQAAHLTYPFVIVSAVSIQLEQLGISSSHTTHWVEDFWIKPSLHPVHVIALALS